METILVSVVSMALIIISTLAVTVSTFQSANRMADAWKTMEARSSSIGQTEIRVSAPPDYAGGIIDLMVANEGHTNLSDFSGWDVILQYQAGDSTYLSYAAGGAPAAGQWTVNGIRVTGGSPEVFDPGILNPGEVMTISINPDPAVPQGEMARMTVATPNGITSQGYVTRK